jgi:hypothetical protein
MKTMSDNSLNQRRMRGRENGSSGAIIPEQIREQRSERQSQAWYSDGQSGIDAHDDVKWPLFSAPAATPMEYHACIGRR